MTSPTKDTPFQWLPLSLSMIIFTTCCFNGQCSIFGPWVDQSPTQTEWSHLSLWPPKVLRKESVHIGSTLELSSTICFQSTEGTASTVWFLPLRGPKGPAQITNNCDVIEFHCHTTPESHEGAKKHLLHDHLLSPGDFGSAANGQVRQKASFLQQSAIRLLLAIPIHKPSGFANILEISIVKEPAPGKPQPSTHFASLSDQGISRPTIVLHNSAVWASRTNWHSASAAAVFSCNSLLNRLGVGASQLSWTETLVRHRYLTPTLVTPSSL